MSAFQPTIISNDIHRTGSVAGSAEEVRRRQASVLREAGLPHDQQAVEDFLRDGKAPSKERQA